MSVGSSMPLYNIYIYIYESHAYAEGKALAKDGAALVRQAVCDALDGIAGVRVYSYPDYYVFHGNPFKLSLAVGPMEL